MTWKKNWFSSILWFCQIIVAALVLVVVSDNVLNQYKIADVFQISPVYNHLIWQGIICVMFLLITLLVFFIIRLIVEKTKNIRVHNSVKIAAEILLFAGLLLGGGVCRFAAFPNPVETNPFFEISAVNTSFSSVPIFHWGYYLYLRLLRCLFLVVGDHLIAGIVLQIVLQFLAVILVYFAIRRIAGVIPAIFTMGFCLLAPVFIKSGLAYGPENLYFFFFGILLLIFSSVLKVIKQTETIKWHHYLGGFFLGICISYMIYLDAIGIILPVACISLFRIYRQDKIKNVFLLFIIILLSVAVGLLGIWSYDALRAGTPLISQIHYWMMSYIPEMEGNTLQLYSPILSKLNDNLYVSSILFVGIIWGVYGFWVKKEDENQRLWVLMTIFSISLSYLCRGALYFDRSFFALFVIIVLAGTGLKNVLYINKNEKNHAELIAVEIPVENFNSDETTVGITTSEEISCEEELPEEASVEVISEEIIPEEVPFEEFNPVKEIKFIENPLPLPKKHVKKTMDYGYEFPEEQLYFDIEISEDDDFDF